MRDLFLSVAIPIALLFALLSPSASVLVLNWIWFQRPHTFSWGMWNTLPVFTIALGITVLSNIVHGQFKPRITLLLGIYLALLSWVTLSTAYAYDTRHAWAFYWIFLPSMWISPIVMFATIHDLRLLKLVIWTMAGGVGINGAKTGIMATLGGGSHITEGISGFVGDNNVFGLVLCMVVAILIGLRVTLPRRRILIWLLWIMIGAILLCIVYTRSRGAIVSLGAIFLFGSLLGHRPVRHSLIVVAVTVAGYWAVPAEHFERLSTIQEYRDDASAMGRIENWGLAWKAAIEHPMLGVGPENHVSYHRATAPSDIQIRVAHNVYMQVLGELGFPGLMMYLTFILIGIATLYSTWRFAIPIARAHPDLAWTENLSFWMLCGYLGYCVGASFLNTFYIEFPWYVIFYGSMLKPMLVRELAVRADSGKHPEKGSFGGVRGRYGTTKPTERGWVMGAGARRVRGTTRQRTGPAANGDRDASA